MKIRPLWILVCLFFLSIAAQATTIHVQNQVVQNWHDNRTSATNPPHVRVYCSDAFFDNSAPPILIPFGAPGTGSVYKDITCSQSGTTVTIPAFDIASTMDASSLTKSAKYTFWWYTTTAQLSTIPIIQDIMVPGSIVSTSGCTPIGTCATMNDLVLYNTPSPALPPDIYPTQAQVTAQIIANISLAAGAPASAKYIVQVPDAGLVMAQALSVLSTGLLKNTTITGVLSIATANVDFQLPISAMAPLVFSSNIMSMPAATGSVDGYLTAANFGIFNGKQAALGFTPENVAQRNILYAGLSGGKVANSQISEVLALGDLTDATDALGTGTTVPKGTFAGIVSGQVISWNGTNFVPATPGSVTSVAVSTDSAFLTVGSSPITTSGTITLNLTSGLTQNRILASPNGSSGTVSLRALVNADLPTVDATHGGTGLNVLPSANHFARVNAAGTAFEDTAFVQGTNITITHGSGTVTIAAASAANHNLLSAVVTDTTPGTVVRGDLVVGQNSGTSTWQRLAIDASNLVFINDGTDAKWGKVNLASSSAVTGVTAAVNGGTGFNGSSAANGTIPIGNGSGFTLATLSAGSNISIVNSPGGVQISASGVLGVAWHNITDPVALNLSLAMGATTTTFTWGNATGGGVDMFTLKDTASNSGTGHVLAINTAASSAAKVVGFFAQGTSNGAEMNSSGVFAPVGTGGVTANALSGLAGNGYVVRTAAGAFTNRSFLDGAGIAWTNPDGVTGAGQAAWNPITFVNSITMWDASQASRLWTANLSGATDPVITFGNNSIDVTTGVLKQGGTAVVLQSFTLTGGTGISAIGDLSTNRTVQIDQSFSPTWTGIHTWTPTARTSGTAAYFAINTPADTGLTASTESIGIKLGVTATRTWATGALALNREIVVAASTYNFAGSSALTSATTFNITGPPLMGGNVSNTPNQFGLWVGTTADGILVPNQISPFIGGIISGKNYALSGTGNIFQIAGWAVNSGTLPTTAIGGYANSTGAGGYAAGGNFVGYVDTTATTAAHGIEVDTGKLQPSAASTAISILSVTYGGNGATAHLWMQAGAAASGVTNAIVLAKAGGFEPVTDNFLAFSGSPTMKVGLNMSAAIFSGGEAAAVLLGNNQFLKAYDSGGTVTHIIGGMDSGNFVLLGSGGVAGGMRVLNFANTLNIFKVKDGGSIAYSSFTGAQITSNQNNYNPDAGAGANGKDAYLQRWSSDASRNVTGLVFQQAAVDAQTILVVNTGAQNIVLVNESASSTAANRFHNSTGADITLAANQAADVIYDANTARWLVFKRN